jgi:hypothetical protein
LTRQLLAARYRSIMVDEDIEREERTIYTIAIVALAPVVIVAIVQRVHFDGGTSLCLLFVVLAAIGLVTTLAGNWRRHLPHARVYERPHNRKSTAHRHARRHGSKANP